MHSALAILTETKSTKRECSSEVQVPVRFRENPSDAPSTSHNEQSMHANENIKLSDDFSPSMKNRIREKGGVTSDDQRLFNSQGYRDDLACFDMGCLLPRM